MYLFIIRHTESEKNIKNQFSSTNDDENLTENGESDAIEIANEISKFITKYSLKCNNIYAANSVRSIKTAEKIAEKLNAEVTVEENLRSTRPGVLEGITKDEVKNSHPEYGHQYYLFEKGVFNVYDFETPEDKEPKREFEKRVNNCVSKILSDKNEDVKVIVAHRSSITAILLDFARRFYNYPVDFSGYIPLELGCVSVLKETERNTWEIIKVNEKCSVINKL
ncbi:MAG: phosphoglycerate mutase family protein [Bacteroidales bacterium]|jgi:broad specificity phosphatase PhoE|nr:phosphoglycerate mutase family protein [Bacteroidales bacterium]